MTYAGKCSPVHQTTENETALTFFFFNSKAFLDKMEVEINYASTFTNSSITEQRVVSVNATSPVKLVYDVINRESGERGSISL